MKIKIKKKLVKQGELILKTEDSVTGLVISIPKGNIR